jgi:hypothetical protein
MYLKDSADAWREDMHRHLSAVGADAPVINTSAPLMVVDSFGSVEGRALPRRRAPDR